MRAISRDSLPHLVECASALVRARISSIVVRLQARWWGIRVPASCTFHGLPLLRRHPGSSIRIGERCSFRSSLRSDPTRNHRCILGTFDEKARIEIGADCGFTGTSILAQASVTIGNNVRVGVNATIIDTDFHDEDPRSAPPRPVVIEDDVWLGMNTVVLKGVRIGKGSLIGAGSVVSRSIPPGVLALGNPAKPVLPLAALRAWRHYDGSVEAAGSSKARPA